MPNKITLLNGNELKCYPLTTQPADTLPDEDHRPDTTGMHLFTTHAFLFYNNADRILSDSRMFLAPVPIQSGIAYTGTSGFQNPTLGIYIEWWLNCEAPVTKDHEGNDALTYYIAGSPLSGTNSCRCVYPDGNTASIVHRPFIPVWRDFININCRYTQAKLHYEAYTLQEVYEILTKK